ncbi:ankyrin repeat and MYND domain-containing protein 1 [Ambystoma mexicanum]|uniref:ankyrin repeat and MYND domain-containing protein 1 n=1 Tax=Ambystoma mexicanum TaxID=8296 RepID=UPI0037E92EFB
MRVEKLQYDQGTMEREEAASLCPEEKANPVQQTGSVQQWADGSSYKGHFEVDVKLGLGEFTWANGERYVGEFYKDHPHGKGTYTWPDISTFTGSFYLGRKEGYGIMEFLDNRTFQGLYRADERFGPGIETYHDGSQDVGFWLSDHLIRLSTKIPGSISLSQYPEYTQTDANLQPITLNLKESSIWIPKLEDDDSLFFQYGALLLNDSYTLPEKIHIYTNDTDHLPITTSFRKECDSKFFPDNEQPSDAEEEPPNVRNLTPLMVRIQKQIYKHRHHMPLLSWDVDSIINGVRENVGPKGPKELNSERLITKSTEGDYQNVYEILRDNLAHVDVADDNGYTALHAASVNRHDDIINLLLDNGGDVNKLNDEGLSPLSLCLVTFYPIESFKRNIAERNLAESEVENVEGASPEAEQDLQQGKGQQEHPLKKSSSCFDIDPEEDPECVVPDLHKMAVGKPLPPASKSKKKGVSETSIKLGAKEHVEEVPEEGRRHSLNEESRSSSESRLFESNCSIFNFGIMVSDDILEWSADILSHNLSMHGNTLDESSKPEGTVRQLAQSKSEYRQKWATIELLLRRGADPNSCSVPMPPLFFAIKAADVKAVQVLLEKGAKTNIRLLTKHGSITPLHIAVALPGIEGVSITELLLQAAADPDARADDQEDIFGPDRCDNANAIAGFPLKGNNAPEVFCNYYLKPNIIAEEGGRTPLHVVSEREDCHKRARDIVHLLLQHSANPNALWSGHSALSMAIASGNDPAVKELLANGVEINLPLGRYVRSALCAALNHAYETKRTLKARIALVDRLVSAGANVLMPITFGNDEKSVVGTAIDYGYYKFFQDKKIANTPYHALSAGGRDTVNGRKQLLEHMGDLVREAATKKEREWVTLGFQRDINGIYNLPQSPGNQEEISLDMKDICRKIAFKYCYQCGRSVGVQLTPCARCKAVYFCSKPCQKKSWNDRHQDECVPFKGKAGLK